MTPPKGVKVRGTCRGCGFVVETEAPKGRVTWRGPCPADGCHHRVVAHRVAPVEDQPAADVKPPATGKRRARRVTSYGSGPSRGVGRGARGPDPANGPAGGNERHELGEHDPDRKPAGGGEPNPAPDPPKAVHAGHAEHRAPLIGAFDLFD